jgi:hypothetical protein
LERIRIEMRPVEPFMAPIAAALARFVALTSVFAIVYCQAPLYYSNQHQYCLHGLARANEGLLRDDWLAGTSDPTPAFSALVATTVRLLPPWVLHLEYALLQGVSAVSLLALFRFVVGESVARRRWLGFLLGLLLIHSALVRWASYRWLNLDYPWYFQAGVAGQYVLGPVLQPSAFGVLLVAAVTLFVHDRPILAALCVGLAVTLHSTYLLAGALLTVGFLAVLLVRRQYLRAVQTGALSLLLVLPVTWYTATTFAPTTAETFRQAQRILVEFRIPHHTRPDLWLDPIAGLQIAWVVLAIFLVRRTPLAGVLGVPFVLAAILTLVQWLSGSDLLALLFPWRISSVLVPIATTVILSRMVAKLPDGVEVVPARIAMAGATLCLVFGGLWIMWTHQGFLTSDNEWGVLAYIRAHKAKEDLYFIPVKVQNLVATTHGSLSSDFKPLPAKRTDDRIIAVDLQGFRLGTGAPLFVDFKSIPYADIDVLEWRHRIDRADEIQRQLKQGNEQKALVLLRNEGVTHVVWPADQELTSGWREMYSDPYYRVYRLPEK